MVSKYNNACLYEQCDSTACKAQVIVEEHERLSPHLLFEIIRRDGEDELNRTTRSLIFSALAAGITISFSFYFKAILTMYLNGAPWADMVTSFGYATGFLVVILGRMQLFTENTITTMIPFFHDTSFSKFFQVMKLWGVVFFFNLIGTAIAAFFLSNSYFVTTDVATSLHQIAMHVMAMEPAVNVIRGIPAGILIAAIVWMMPMSQGFSFFMILCFTYFISLGGFSHVVVGSCEAAYEVIHGNASLFDYFFRFLLPTGFGNVLGGTFVFTLMVRAQVTAYYKKESKEYQEKVIGH